MKKAVISFLILLFIMSYSYAQDTLNYSDSASSIEAKAGDNIVITFESNQITGLKWKLTKPLDEKIIELVNVEYVLGYARFQGAGGKEIWTLKALAPGETTISLEYINPNQNNAVAVKKKTFEVIVKEPSLQAPSR